MATPTDRIDRPRSVRAGEELDVVRLRPWLAGALHRDVADIVIEQFPSGYSNLTYLVNVGSHEYVLRRPPVGNRVESAHDMLREYRILEKLHPVYSLAPRPVAACSDVEILGAPFYLMERRRGVIWRGQPMALATDAARNRQLGDALADNLAALHGLDIEATGLFEFGKPAGYISRQVAGWTKRINAAKTDDIPAVAQVADWLAASIPAQLPPVMLHNDYKHDNVIFAADLPAEIVAVLDWEMATVGDYRMDLGTTLAYWVQADDPPEFHPVAMCPTSLPGCPTRAEFAARYFAARQIPAVDLTFFYCYGLFKVAGIVQQIYSRYRAGLTTDPRFARLNETVVALAQQALRATAAGQSC